MDTPLSIVPAKLENRWISLNKKDLINQSDNSFTFSWNRVSNNNVLLQLKYLTIPKYFPSLLLKYNSNDTNSISNNSTSNEFEAKLIPCHSSGQHTTYQALGNGLNLKQLPNTFSIQLSSPNSPDPELELNIITALKITKQNQEICVITREPHYLLPTDTITLEFPSNKTCYRISHVRIIDPTQFWFESPFVGIFNSNFKILRNNWTLDLTLVISTRN